MNKILDRHYVISLPDAKRRQASIREAFSAIGREAHIIHAYDGNDEHFPFHQYKAFSGQFWHRTEDFKPGAFACYLSHALCWEQISTNKTDTYALILEDDACFNLPALADFAIDDIPVDFDIIFLNKAMHVWCNLLPSMTDTDRHFVSISELFLALFEKGTFFEKKLPAPCAYGYLISPKGAKKLLKMMATRKISMGVDYAMVFNALDAAFINRLLLEDKAKITRPLQAFLNKERELLKTQAPIQLKAYVYRPDYLIDIKHFESTINHQRFLNNNVFDKPY